MGPYAGAAIVGAAIAVLVGAAVLALTDSHISGSSASDQTTLPSVVSQPIADARAEIEGLGLHVREVSVGTGVYEHPVVEEQIPASGESVPANAVVTLKYGPDYGKVFGGE